jgi:hypothetical protein
VADEALREEPSDLREAGASLAAVERVEPIRDRADPRQPRDELAMLLAEAVPDVGRDPRPSARTAVAGQRPQRVQDHRDVDRLLDDRPPDGREQPGRAEPHPDEGQRHPREHALRRDPARTAGDPHRLGEPVEPVHDQDDVGRLGRGRRPSGAHRDADVGRRERRGVVHAVADHHRHAALALGDDGVDLVDRIALGQDPVDADRDADRFGDVGVIAGDHHDALDPGAGSGSHVACPLGSGRPG